MTYWRITYNGIGIYEAFKEILWKTIDDPKKEWNNLKNSNVFDWLPVPTKDYINCKSYFTEKGYELFMKNTYPKFIECLDKNKITIQKYELKDNEINIEYKDTYQIVIKE